MDMLLGVTGFGNRRRRCFQVGVLEHGRVAHGGVDAEPEQVADSADVASGGVDLVQDAVLAQRAGLQVPYRCQGYRAATGVVRGADRRLTSR